MLEVSEKVISADCTNRPSVVINGTFPGPELRFKAGEKVKIRVYNRLKTHNVTLHGHGIAPLLKFRDKSVNLLLFCPYCF